MKNPFTVVRSWAADWWDRTSGHHAARNAASLELDAELFSKQMSEVYDRIPDELEEPVINGIH